MKIIKTSNYLKQAAVVIDEETGKEKVIDDNKIDEEAERGFGLKALKKKIELGLDPKSKEDLSRRYWAIEHMVNRYPEDPEDEKYE